MNLAPNGQQGTGVGFYGQSYPFVEPDDELRGLLTEIHFSHDIQTIELPVRIVWLYGFDKAFDYPEEMVPAEDPTLTGGYVPEHTVDIVLADGSDGVVFDSTLATSYQFSDFGGRIRIHEWRTADAVLRVAQHSAFPNDHDIPIYGREIIPTEAGGVLDERTHSLRHRRLAGIMLDGQTFTSRVRFQAGYNMELSPTTTTAAGKPDKTEIGMAAIAGAGLGRFSDCTDDNLFLRSLNKVGTTDTGEFNLAAKECYSVGPPSHVVNGRAYVTQHQLQFDNSCGPCCACADYVAVYKAIKGLFERYRTLARKSKEIRDTLDRLIDRWNASRDCRINRIVDVAVLQSGTGLLDVIVRYCNMTDECQRDVDVPIHVLVSIANAVPPASGESPVLTIPACTTYRTTDTGVEPYTLEGDMPDLSAHWDAVSQGRTAIVRFRILVANVWEGMSVDIHAGLKIRSILRGDIDAHDIVGVRVCS